MKDTPSPAGRRPLPVDVPVEGMSPPHPEVVPIGTIPRQRRLSPAGRRLLGYLRSLEARHGRGCWPAVETMAHAVGVTDRTIQRQLRQLAAGGWLVIVEDARSPVGRRLFVAPETQARRENVTLGVDEAGKGVSPPATPATTTVLPPDPDGPRVVPIGTTAPDQAEAIAWFVARRKPRNPAAYRWSLERRGVSPEILAEHAAWKASRRPVVASVARTRPTIDPAAERAEAERLGAFLEAAKADPSNPLHTLMRRRAARG